MREVISFRRKGNSAGLPEEPAMTRLSASPSAENKHPTPIGKPHFGRRRAILTSDKRAFPHPPRLWSATGCRLSIFAS